MHAKKPVRPGVQEISDKAGREQGLPNGSRQGREAKKKKAC